jgi:hypothetical protein
MIEERLAILQWIVLTVQSRSRGLGRQVITSSFYRKTNGVAVKYQISVCNQSGDIDWVINPFKAGKWNNIKLYRRDLKGALSSGEMVEADRGYMGDDTVRCPVTVFSWADSHAKSNARARHKMIILRLLIFGVLSNVFRDDRDLHQFAFHAVAVITHIENGSPPFGEKL